MAAWNTSEASKVLFARLRDGAISNWQPVGVVSEQNGRLVAAFNADAAVVLPVWEARRQGRVQPKVGERTPTTVEFGFVVRGIMARLGYGVITRRMRSESILAVLRRR